MSLENLGGWDEEMQETEKVVSMEEKKKERKPFHFWEVGDRTYKLKLNTSMICKLENKYRCNISTLVIGDDMPPLAVMLTIIHAAMTPWEHGVSYADTQKMYDMWQENGGNQQALYTKVIIPLMAVSGFFTENQARILMDAVEAEDELN